MEYSIEKFLSSLEAGRGPAYKDRYSVTLTVPEAVSTKVPGETIDVLCETVSIPGTRIATSDYAPNLNPIKIPYSFITNEIEIGFYLTHDFDIYTMFQEWASLIVNVSTYEIAYKNDIMVDSWTIWHSGKDHKTVRGMKIKNVMLIGLSPVSYASVASAIQSFTITVSFDRKEWISA